MPPSDVDSDTEDWDSKIIKYIDEYAQTDWAKIAKKRADLAAKVTKACKKAQTTYDAAIKTNTANVLELKTRLEAVNISASQLNYFVRESTARFTPEMKVTLSEEYNASVNYFAKYDAAAKTAVGQMNSLRSQLEKRKKPTVPPPQSEVARLTADGPPSTSSTAAVAAVAESSANLAHGRGDENQLIMTSSLEQNAVHAATSSLGQNAVHAAAENLTSSSPNPGAGEALGNLGMLDSSNDTFTQRPWGNFNYAAANQGQQTYGNQGQQTYGSQGQQTYGPPLAPFRAPPAGPSTDANVGAWLPQPTQDLTGMAAMQVGNPAAMSLYGQSFDIMTFIGRKFSGQSSRFPEFILRMQMADLAMSKVGYNMSQRFLELLKVVEGEPLKYIKDLPLMSLDSYPRAIQILKGVYLNQQNELRNIIAKEFSHIAKCHSSFASRQQLHSRIVSWFNCIASKNISNHDIYLSIMITHFEAGMDDALKREWTKQCSRQADLTKPLGYQISIQEFIDKLFKIMLTDLQLNPQSAHPNSSYQPRMRVRNGVHAVTGENAQFTDEGEEIPLVEESTYATVAGTPIRRGKQPANQNQRQRQAPPPPANRKPPQQARYQGPAAAAGGRRPAQFPPARPLNFPQRKIEVKVACPFCWDSKSKTQLPHSYPLRCPKLRKEPKMKAEEVRRIARQRNLCFNCFAPNHNPCPAPADSKCRQCGKRHHTILCNNKP